MYLIDMYLSDGLLTYRYRYHTHVQVKSVKSISEIMVGFFHAASFRKWDYCKVQQALGSQTGNTCTAQNQGSSSKTCCYDPYYISLAPGHPLTSPSRVRPGSCAGTLWPLSLAAPLSTLLGHPHQGTRLPMAAGTSPEPSLPPRCLGLSRRPLRAAPTCHLHPP